MPDHRPPTLRGFIGEQPVLNRLARAGLRCQYTEQKPPFYPFHGSAGCWLVFGSLYYGPLTDADTFAHEACHALLLSPEERAAWVEPQTDTSEEITTALQVELWRGIPGAGVHRAILWMVDVGYGFGVLPNGDDMGCWS
jgi:hypothetical protein